MGVIRVKCYECSGYDYSEVSRCECQGCALWPFRFGRRPTSEDLAKWREPFKKFMGAHASNPKVISIEANERVPGNED